MLEGVAVVRGGGALCCRSHVCKDEVRSGLGGNSLEVRVVPRRRGRGKDAWVSAQLGAGIVAYSEAIGIVCTPPSVLHVARDA